MFGIGSKSVSYLKSMGDINKGRNDYKSNETFISKISEELSLIYTPYPFIDMVRVDDAMKRRLFQGHLIAGI